ncbi:MAG TPA: ATP-dependent DNA helicase RecQ, partial [Candidatus Marinimicrobia bacterium]|nr:ATP-dependent DNA helicase RecQ [Candidatus Neomarinimicrobiota bacterium]
MALVSEAQDSSDANYDIAISFNDTLNVGVPTTHIQDISFHHSVAYEEQPIEPMRAVNTDADLLVYFLTYIFRHPEFNEGQHEAISRAMSGQDTIVLLPTGAGKSVAYQLTSLLMPGVMIVVSPLIALINDQLDNLRKIGIDRVISITSQTRDVTERERAYDAFEQAQFLFCYVAPERFQMDEFRTAIQALKQCTPVSVIAVDEAHCVSEWGHDFRTSYLNIGRISRDTCSAKGFTPPLLALTGTASHAVLRDIQRELNIDDFEAIITPSTFDRKEIEFLVTTAKPDEKFETLKSILQRALPAKFNQNQSTFFTVRGKKTHCGIVFCPHVNWKLGILEFADRIHDELGVDAKVYAGKAPKKIPPSRWEEIKLDSAQGFKNNRYPLLVSTKAFGMGIDKPNIRYTTHISLPHSVEQYYQEAGRAGRDRQPALSVLIYTSLDKKRTDRLLSPETSPEEVAKEVENTKWKDKDDIMHALFFHVGSFQGKKPERDLYRDFISRADSLKERSEFPYRVSKRDDLNQTEKVLHRLCILGVISDYTIKYSRLEFRVCSTGADNTDILTNYLKYVGGYNRARIPNESSKLALHLSEPKEAFMEKAYETLIDFIYDTIERGRRRALREMASLAEDCSVVKDQSSAVREKILSYLQTSFSEEIEDLLEEVGELEKLKKLILGSTEPETGMLIGGIQSPLQAKEIRGQAARYLESYPTHTGILLLRGFSELLCADANAERACENILAGLKYAHEWQLSKQQVYDGISHLLGALANASHEQYSY